MSSTARIREIPDTLSGSGNGAMHNLNGTSPAETANGSDLSAPSLYNNRELSLLEYHQRVLEEADDQTNPLLERLRFLCIVAANLDQFFEVRVAGLKQQRLSHLSLSGSDGMGPGEQLAAISGRVRQMVNDLYRIWREGLIPALEENNIFFLRCD